MKLAKAIHAMDFSKLWQLLCLCLRHPLYAWPSVKATRKTVAICNEEFGKAHHKNGRENAFRHALWNALLIHYCRKWYPSDSRAKAWAKKITDWHERFSVNGDLAKAMDIHNNRVGREFVMNHLEASIAQLRRLMKGLIPLSRKRTSIQEMTATPTQLVHIEDD